MLVGMDPLTRANRLLSVTDGWFPFAIDPTAVTTEELALGGLVRCRRLLEGMIRVHDAPDLAGVFARAIYETYLHTVYLLLCKSMIERRTPLVAWPATFNSQELLGLIGWPIDAVAVPGLTLGGCRLVAASPAIPRSGTAIGDSNFPGDPRPLALDTQARLRHVQVLGPTGTGKSTLLVNMAVQDLEAGLGIILLDPKGDLVQSVLERMPPKRCGDVIVLDPADTTWPVGLNPLESVDDDHAEVVVENLGRTVQKPVSNFLRPSTRRHPQSGSSDARRSEGHDALRGAPDPHRSRLSPSSCGKSRRPGGAGELLGLVRGTERTGKSYGSRAPVLNKVRAFTMRPRVRSIIGQS
jgi:hypothetical protein